LSQLASADPTSIVDPRPQHGRGSYLSLTALRRVERRLSTIRPEDRAELAGTDAKRADTLLPGAVVLRTILERLGVDGALVASTGLREGLMVDYMAERADGAWALQA
jgi:exopolyphosphatase/guanosine-5'-triphosphate,3'-diphosphate pyrophosphatase